MGISKYDKIIERFNIVDGDYRTFENHFINGKQITFGWPKDYCPDQRVWIGIDNEEEKRVTKNEAERLATGEITLRQIKSSSYQLSSNYQKSQGHCIRCSDRIDHNTDKPFCYSCFKTWAQFSNENYSENYCHSCGRSYSTSMARPECRSCYFK